MVQANDVSNPPTKASKTLSSHHCGRVVYAHDLAGLHGSGVVDGGPDSAVEGE